MVHHTASCLGPESDVLNCDVQRERMIIRNQVKRWSLYSVCDRSCTVLASRVCEEKRHDCLRGVTCEVLEYEITQCYSACVGSECVLPVLVDTQPV